MTDRSATGPAIPSHTAESYSPQRRTALVLTGTGTAGAYHAGVLRALHEAGVKIDIVAGRGVGVVGALFAAVDGAQRLWDDKGFWRAPTVARLYAWRTVPVLVTGALGLAVALVAVPLAVLVVGLVVFPIDFVLKIIGVGGAAGLVGEYLHVTHEAMAPDALPTWLPRIVLLVLGLAAVTALVDGWSRGREGRGRFWWRLVKPPLSSDGAIDHCWQVLWDLVRGAAQLKRPSPAELGRRYTELLAENLGQPGFRELVITVHDADAHRDLVFALVSENRRRDLIRRSTTEAAESRRAEVFDLAGLARDHVSDAVAGALTVPLATDWHRVTFAADGYWRGETHRLCDRPASLIRLIDELIELDAEQIVLVAGAAEAPGPHAMLQPRLDGRGRLGEYIQSSECAVVRDATTTTEGVRIFIIRPAHNPIGPFDFEGGYDDRSRRRQGLTELMGRGYEDAYHQFIEPVVGASGEEQSL
jgi:predicted acylesterase/phospholipase RssA